VKCKGRDFFKITDVSDNFIATDILCLICFPYINFLRGRTKAPWNIFFSAQEKLLST